jgi:EmrB/QacA subfamily drug resistance transporter
MSQTPETSLDPNRWRALSVIALVQFMLVLDVTVVNVALPHIQTDLHFSRAGLAWVVDGYVLTAGGLILLGGRLGDLLGRKRMFVLGVLLFVAASAMSGASVDPAMLVASRFAQGVGEAIASPAAFGLVALLFTEPRERATAVGVFGGVAGLGGTLGPVISGLLITVSSWRWIFYINVPVGIVCAVVAVRLVTESRANRPALAPRPDYAGAMLGTGGLVGVVYGFIAAGNHPWGSTQVVLSLLLGGAALVAFVLRERTAVDPLVPHGFMANATRVSANLANLFFASVFFTVVYLLTLYLQQVEHFSVLLTGVSYLPFGVAIGAGIGTSSALITRIGVKPLLATGGVFVAAGVLLLTRIAPHGSWPSQVLPALLVLGVGSGLSFAAFGNASVHDVSEQDASLAAGVQSSAQQIGGAVGLAVLATLALRHSSSLMAHGQSFTAAATHGSVLAFEVGAIVSLIGVLFVAFSPMARSAGIEISTAGFGRSPEAGPMEPAPAT